MEVADEITSAARDWVQTSLEQRTMAIRRSAGLLRNRREELARLITQEMGKVISESYAEIDKCIFCCEYYAEQAPAFLVDELIQTKRFFP